MNRSRYIVAVCVILGVAGGALVWQSSRGTAGVASLSETTRADLCALAKSMAANNGEPAPAGISATTSTAPRQAVVTVIEGKGEDVMSEEPVYAVQETGNFVGYEASVPDGQQLPKGPALAFTVSASNGDILDWGIADQAADLSSLGGVVNPCAAGP